MANNMMNFQQMIQFIKAGNNPEQFVMMILQNGAKNNPVFANILQLAQNKNYQGVENVVKNLAKQRGIDFDKEFNNFRQTLGFLKIKKFFYKGGT